MFLWAQASWTQRLLGKTIQEQSWPLLRLYDLDKDPPPGKGHKIRGHNGPVCKRPTWIGSLWVRTHNIFYSIPPIARGEQHIRQLWSYVIFCSLPLAASPVWIKILSSAPALTRSQCSPNKELALQNYSRCYRYKSILTRAAQAMDVYCTSESSSDLCILDTSLTTIPFNIRGEGGFIVLLFRNCAYISQRYHHY